MISYSEEELYNLTRTSTDFDCLPRGTQVEELVRFIINSGNSEFLIEDLKNLFMKSNLKSTRTGKLVKPSSCQLSISVDKLIANNRINVVKDIDVYKVKH
jgi:hypothetical protein